MKRGKLSEKDRLFIAASQTNGVEAAEIARQLDRSVDTVQKVLNSMVQVDEVATEEQPTAILTQDEKDQQIAALQDEVKELHNIVPAKPKGVIVMTARDSARVDEIIKATPTTYFREDCMVSQTNKKTGTQRRGH